MKKNYNFLTYIIFFSLGLNLFAFKSSLLFHQQLTLVLLLVLLISWCAAHFQWSILEWLKNHRFLVIIFFSVIISLALFGRDLQAQWGVIDDHEIMSFIGTRGYLPLTQIPNKLLQTEVGKPGQALRYRPTYYFLRLLETSLWGKNATLWYATRLVILITSLSLAWLLLQKWLGFYVSGLFLTYLLSFSYWKDIFARLGPGETYAVFGLTLFCWCFYQICTSLAGLQKNRLRWELLGLAVGSLICVGSKENFLLLLLPFLFLFVFAWRKKKLTLTLASLAVVTTAFFILVGASVIIATQRIGQDVYANLATPISRIKVLAAGVKTSQSKEMMVAIGLVGVLLAYLYLGSPETSKIIASTKKTLFWLMLLWTIYLSQYVFYNGVWPNANRYDFPGMLVLPFFGLIVLLLIEKILKEVDVSLVIRKGLRAGVLLSFSFAIVTSGFAQIEAAVKQNVQETTAFTQRIKQITDRVRQHPAAYVVVESSNAWDYEATVSYERFLRAYQVTNPLVLRIHSYSPSSASTALEKQIASILVIKSSLGGNGYDPLSNLQNQPSGCYSLNITKGINLKPTDCIPLP